jgi:hypothetical protein
MLRSKLVRDIALYVSSFLAVVLISRLIGHELGSSFYVFMGTMAIFRSVGILMQDRLVQLTFDDATGKVVFEYKALLGRVRTREIPTVETHLEVGGYSPSLGVTVPVKSVAFMKGKWEAFEIRVSKDGLSQSVLAEIVGAAQERGLPVQPS